VEIETNQVDYCVSTQGCDRLTKRSVTLCRLAIQHYMLDGLPFRRVVIRSARSAGNGYYVVALVYEPWDEPGADVSGSANDYGAQLDASMSSKTLGGHPRYIGLPLK
jgi:hypothetical protein